jgi:two-component system, LytTR family, response regulator
MSPDLVSAIVVDDEPLARRRLVRLLHKDPAIELRGAYESAAEAAGAMRAERLQLMLLDIRMPGTDGIALVRSLDAEGVRPYTIFVTAYGDRPLDALGVGAIDYLLKPFDEDRFTRALARAKVLIAADRHTAAVADNSRSPDSAGRGRLLLGTRGKMTFLTMEEIEFVQAAGKHVKVYAGGRCLIYRNSITQLERRLDPALFVRVHRSTLVNVEQIVEIHPLFHGDYELKLKRGTRLTLSRRYRDRLKPFMMS